MKGIKKAFGVLISSLVALSLTIGLIIVVTYSWFTNSQLVEPDLSGFSVSAYFGGGKGTEDDPFLIKNQRHLYNLAWLQYLGYFNKVGKLNSNGVIETNGHTSEMTQYSFSITQDLNMNGWDLPPIGTSLQPFVGLLNGNGYSIYNLHTTNQFTDFGKRHPSSVTSENFANVEMIGFMGVVGTISSMYNYGLSIDTAANAVANIKLKDNEVETRTSTSLVGIAVGYINGKVEDIGIVDSGLYIDSSTHIANMEDVSTYTVAGYATDGYVTKVSNTKASVLNPSGTDKTEYVFSDEGDTTGWGGSIDMYSTLMRINDIRNNYCNNSTGYVITGNNYFNYAGNPSLIGSAVSNYYMYNSQYTKTGVSYNEKIGSFSYVMTGTETDYSGLLIAYLNSGHDNNNVYDGYKITDGTNCIKINANGSISNTTNLDEATPFYFSSATGTSTTISTYIGQTRYYLQNNNGTLRLYTSSTTWDVYRGSDDLISIYNGNYNLRYSNGQWRLVEETSFKIYNGNYYLSYDNNHNITNDNANNAKSWQIANNRIYTVDNGTTYYLTATTSGALGLSTNINDARQWTATTGTSSGQTYYRYSFRENKKDYYLKYNSGWKAETNSYNLYRRFEKTLYQEFTDNPEIVGINYGGNDVTYLPLNVEDDYTPKSINTGYIIGGTRDGSSSGAVRISRYGQYSSGTSQNIKNYNYTSKEFNPNSVKTVNSSGQVVTINDDDTSYVKFLESKAKLENIISKDTKGLYGLHFMDVPISMNSLIMASYALVDGTEYNDGYQLPTSAIDFNLHSKGYVNFFAGTYGSYSSGGQDNCFFTVHQIFRDSTHKYITAIKEIKAVYATNDEQASYVYYYGNNQYSAPYRLSAEGERIYQSGYDENTILSSAPAGYSLVFDTSRLGINNNVGSSNNRYYAYYFEIPMNDGEFALGAVSGGTGAYLMYLDISANAQKLNRTTITQKSTVVQSDFVYPNGISIITNNTTINPSVISLDASTSSVFKFGNVSGEKTIAVSRSAAGINYQTDLSDAVPIYVPRTVTVTKNSAAIQATAVRTTTSIYSQITYIDHNVSTGDIFETIVQSVKTDSENPVYSYKIYKIGENHTTTGFTRTLVDQTVTKPDWKLYAIYKGKNVNVDLTSASDTNANAMKTTLQTVTNSTGTPILVFDYDTYTSATNTFDIIMSMILDTNDNTGKYYKFNGDDVYVTTTNTGGTVIYVTTRNTTYTFKMNDVVINAATINVPQTA